MRPGLKFGLMAGGAAILFSLAIYFSDKALLFTSVLNLLVPLLIFFGAGVLATIERRKLQAGVLHYDQAMVTSLGAFVTGLLIWTVLLLALMLFIDPELIPLSKTIRLQDLEMQRAQLEPAVYENTRKAIQESDARSAIIGYMLADLLYLLAGLILFLFSSRLLKRDGKN